MNDSIVSLFLHPKAISKVVRGTGDGGDGVGVSVLVVMPLKLECTDHAAVIPFDPRVRSWRVQHFLVVARYFFLPPPSLPWTNHHASLLSFFYFSLDRPQTSNWRVMT